MATPSSLAAERALEDYAQVYVNEFHPPADEVLLSTRGKNKGKALAQYAIGRRLENQGDTEAAIRAYQRVIELQPDAFPLARKTAYLMAQSGRELEAQKMLKRNLEANPNQALAHITLSEFLSTYNDGTPENREESFRIAEEALEKFPDDSSVYEHVAKLYLGARRRSDAKEVVQKALKQSTPDPYFWLSIGRLATRIYQFRPDQSDAPTLLLVNEIYLRALSRSGEDSVPAEEVGDFFRVSRQFKEAEEVYRDLIEKHTDRLNLRKKLAAVYGGLDQEDKVIETLQGILEIDSENVGTHEKLAEIFLRQGKRKEYVKHQRIVLRIKKEGPQKYLTLAYAMVRTEENEPLDPEVAEDALKFLAESAYLFPEEPGFPYLASRIQRVNKRWGEAVDQMEKTEKLAEISKPEMLDEGFYFDFASVVERDGDIKRAEKLFRKTLELINKNQPSEDPEGRYQKFVAQTYNYLGYMWLENGMKIDEAGEMIKTAVDLDPSSGAIADSLGWFYFAKGNFEKARDELLRAEGLLEKPDAVILDHIAQAYHKLNDRANAIEYMKKAIDLDPEKEEYKDRLKEFEKAPSSPSPVVDPNAPEKASPKEKRSEPTDAANADSPSKPAAGEKTAE